MNQRQLQIRGARTILFCPEEHSCLFGMAGELSWVEMLPLIAYRLDGAQETRYSTQGLVVRHCAQNVSRANSVELKKLQAQAQKDKPQRADQLPQEAVFELSAEDGLGGFLTASECDFLFGEECLRLNPGCGFGVHRLFAQGGALNWSCPGFDSRGPQVLVELLSRYLEQGCRGAVSRAPRAPGLPKQDAEPESVRALVSPESQQLFQKKKLPPQQAELFSFASYVLAVSAPEDFDQRWLGAFQEAAFDVLGFGGLQIFTQGALWNAYGPQRLSGVLRVELGPRYARAQVYEPHLPVVSKAQATLHGTMAGVAQAMLYFLGQAPELRTVGQIIALAGQEDLEKLSFIPEKLRLQYSNLPDRLQKAVWENLCIQLEFQVFSLLSQGAVSLHPADNKQAIIQLHFPLSQEGIRVSFCLGWLGLASARVLLHPSTVALVFCSQAGALGAQGPWRTDISAEHRENTKATKVQISPEEMAPLVSQGRQLLGDVDPALALQPNAYAGLLRPEPEEVLCILARNVHENARRNEAFLRESGKGASEALILVPEGLDPGQASSTMLNKEEESGSQVTQTEEQVAMGVVKALWGAAVLTGVVGDIPGLREALEQRAAPRLLEAFPQERALDLKFLADGLLDSRRGFLEKQLGLLQLVALSDAGLEAAVAREEYCALGGRAWVERGPFVYPAQ